MQQAAVGAVFLVTVAGFYLRPFGAREWQVAVVGLAIVLVLNPLSTAHIRDALADSASIVAFFLGLMLLAGGASSAGIYEDAARLIAARRVPGAALLALIAAAIGITAILSNDATPLILTPAVFAAARLRRSNPTGQAFAVTLVADGASLLLPVSNPVNLLFFERFDFTVAQWATSVLPAAAAATLALSLVLLIQARREPLAAGSFLAEPAPSPAVTRAFRHAAYATFALLAVAYVVAAFSGTPLGLVTLTAGLVLLVVGRRLNSPGAAYRAHVSVSTLVFIAALVLLVEAVSSSGVLDWLSSLLELLAERPPFVAILGAALLAAFLSNLMNNWPAAVVLAAALADVPGTPEPLIVGTLIGATIGANLTTLGSLSTVFWLSLTRKEGVTYTPALYARRAALPTTAALAAAISVAALVQ